MAPAASTSLERTYRYLRIGIAGTVVIIFTAVGLATAEVGLLPSISDYFYSPARNAFVGALIAASIALLALSGTGPERALLDAAALFAPLIAVVPTTVVPGTVPGVEVPCENRCFPPAFEADTANGVWTYLIVGTLTVVIAALLIALGQVPLRAVGLSLILTVIVLLAVGLTWMLAHEWFLAQAHFVATVGFFGLFAAVAIRAAFPRRGDPPEPLFRLLYTIIAVLLVIDLIVYAVLAGGAVAEGFPVVLLCEAIALLLFLAFWVVQGIDKWGDADPTLLPT